MCTSVSIVGTPEVKFSALHKLKVSPCGSPQIRLSAQVVEGMLRQDRVNLRTLAPHKGITSQLARIES